MKQSDEIFYTDEEIEEAEAEEKQIDGDDDLFDEDDEDVFSNEDEDGYKFL